MKVLHILSELQFSGAELMLYTASGRLNNAGLQTTVLATGENEGIFAKYLKEPGWQIAHIPLRKNLDFFKKLYRFIKINGFDVVHVHTEGSFIYIATIARLAGAKKILGHIHNNFLFDEYLTKRRRFHHKLADKLLGVQFISIGDSVEKTERDIYNTKTTLVHNWIDVNKFSEEKLPHLAADNTIELRFITVGKCLAEKRHIDVLKLVKHLDDKGIACRHIQIGSGPLEAEERKWADDNGIMHMVNFISSTNEVEKYLAASNFFLMPSTFEGVSIACLEAMAAGLFCFVNDAPGLNNLIQDGKSGFVGDFLDTATIADRILQICKDPESYSSMTQQAKQYVFDKHSVNNIDQIIAIYNQ
ncbi:glycosyltransferase family 4 protein [Mucilaginibacter sp. HMF5004]|uniref:glycosyltransferase family 4 protein n=1 Tax=Mucilaginibacter rivuli TaxID=2857527 RepID=UPI001C5E347A|nr:glycosyltransferase family 4 protein [Mucilaginibacter rivuli]MBW4890160.1 glycosyltransferase family 4 protein [Mucilaginibacter rivuli]